MDAFCSSLFWDVEETFLNDPYHEAGLFARKIKKSWKPGLDQFKEIRKKYLFY